MATPSINESFDVISVASGTAYSLQFTAANTPTSWSVTGAPSGLSINNSGLLSGPPSSTTTSTYTLAVSATNVDGTDTTTFVMVVSPRAVGDVQDEFAIEVDFDMTTRRLQLPGEGSPVPAGQPAVVTGESTTDEDYLMVLTKNERFDFLAALKKRGVHQAISLDEVSVTLKQYGFENKGITLGSGEPTVSGSGTEQRYRLPVLVAGSAIDRMLQAGKGEDRTFFDAYLKFSFLKKDDASDFVSDLEESAIASLDQDDSKAFAIAVDLTETYAYAAYRLELKFVCPTDTGLEITVTRDMKISWSGSAYSASEITGTGIGSGISTTPANWDTTLTNTSITGGAGGLTINGTLVTTAQTDGKFRLVLPLQNYTVEDSGGGYLTLNATDTESWTFYNGASSIGTWTPAGADDEGTVSSDVGSVVSESVTAYFNDADDTVTLVFPSDTDVTSAKFDDDTPVIDIEVNPTGPSYTNTKVTAQLTGLEDPSRALRLTSHAAKVRVYDDHT